MKVNKIINYISNFNSNTNVYGIARSFLALGLFLTLSANSIDYLIDYSSLKIENPVSKYNLFYLLRDYPVISKAISLIILFLVIIGWRPRVTVILHWWVSYSFFLSCVIIDGGDQISSILTFLLIPIGITDSRKWHWDMTFVNKNPFHNITNYFSYIAIRIQACVIYLFAGTEKISVNEWKNGTVLYYWFSDPTFGANDYILKFLTPIIESSLIIFISWGVIILEILLSMGLVMNKKYWRTMFILGVLFHFSIVLIHGLVSFFFSMLSLLIIYFIPLNKNIEIKIPFKKNILKTNEF